MSFTPFQAEVAQARAILEIAAGEIDGPGLQFVRAYVGAVDEGRITDPSAMRQIPPKPKAPFQARPLTNEIIDGREPEKYAGPSKGTREWFEALKDRVKQ
jgi:hypothetical protein